MPLPMSANVTVDIYRTASAATPYALGALSKAGVRAYLAPAVQNGRFGSATWLKWTHILYLEPQEDIRDAYNTQIDPARNNALADTVILKDATTGNKTAFYVAFVERVAHGTPQAYFRAYLDRFLPNAWPTTAL